MPRPRIREGGVVLRLPALLIFRLLLHKRALGLLYYDYYNGCLIITMARERERERGLPSSLFYDDPFAYISLAVNLIY